MAGYESEKILEENLIKQLVADGYERVYIKDINDLHDNFRRQINKHNSKRLEGHELSDKEFERLLLAMGGKGVFGSAQNLRNLQTIQSDDGKPMFIELFNRKDWCQNEFQVTNQVTMMGKYENRYDVTLLINGLPLVQIELKKRGVDFKEAFNQIVRYSKHSYKDLYKYVQIFVISNGIDTKYFANNDGELNFQYTFYWTDKKNNRIDNLQDFAFDFLARCHISKMIARYMIVDETSKSLMVMRPYQYYAVESLIKRASETNNNAYVWHTTGSGKTLTSFKLSQLLSKDLDVAQVFFLVDRKDLDSQTLQEFNRFQAGTVDMTDSTDKLIQQMKDPSVKIVLTTIQKMSNACKNDKYTNIFERYNGKKVVFIIDECHRSQFGQMHKIIKQKFPRAQYFGFTGTPRLKENPSQDGRTSADIFEKMVHHYLIKDAIADGNVLGFSVDYVKTINSTVDLDDDEKVEAIDTEEVLMDDQRISNVVDYILKIHNSKTRNKMYNSLFAVKSIDMLVKYYDEFKKRNSNLKIAAIYTYGANEDGEGKPEHSRDSLERMIADYNKMFDTNYNTSTFSGYFQDVSKKIKNGQLDMLLVVNMFLTGFDAKCLNTLYVDKRLKHHDLIQAFSRTNRVEKATKPYGNIVCFQTSKKAVDTAIKLFSMTDNADTVLMKDYVYYRDEFRKTILKLKENAWTPADTEHDGDEKKQLEFVLIFRYLIRLLVKLNTFMEFSFNKEELGISKKEFDEYLSKYKKFARRDKKDKVSILDDISFDLELLQNTKINVHYILMLIKNAINEKKPEKKQKSLNDILKLIDSSTDEELHLKSELIKGFVMRVAPLLDSDSDFDNSYNSYMEQEREKEITELSQEYGLAIDNTKQIIGDYEFGGIIDLVEIKSQISKEAIQKEKEINKLPTKMQAKNSIANKIMEKIQNIVRKYI